MAETNLKELSKGTIKNLKNQLIEKKPKKSEDINQVIKECFKTSFVKVEDDSDKKKLYKLLSTQLHPDRLSNNHQELYAYLLKYEAANHPQQILNESYKNPAQPRPKSLFDDPIAATTQAVNYFLEKLNYFQAKSDNYIEPFKTIAKISSTIISILLIITAIAVIIPFAICAIAIGITRKIQDLLINLITNDKYEVELKGYQQQKMDQLSEDEILDKYGVERFQQELGDELISRNPTTEKIEEEIASELNEKAKNEVRNSISPKYFTKLALVSKGLYNSLISLPNGFFPKLVSIIIVKPLQLIAAPFILASVVIIETLDAANLLLFIASMTILATIKLASVFVLNTPLYVLDAIRNIGNSTKSCCSENTEEDNEEYSKPSDHTQSHAKISSRIGLVQTNGLSSTSENSEGSYINIATRGNYLFNKPLKLITYQEQTKATPSLAN